LNENSDFSTNRDFTSHGIENVTSKTLVSVVADFLGHNRGAETLRCLDHPGWLVGPELKDVLCVSGGKGHSPPTKGLLEVGRVSIHPLDLIFLESIVDRGLNREGGNLPVILGVLWSFPYVQDEELHIPETATHKTCCVTTDRAVESQCDLVTGKDRVVIALDEIPFRLAHPARTTFRNLVEKEAAVGRIR